MVPFNILLYYLLTVVKKKNQWISLHGIVPKLGKFADKCAEIYEFFLVSVGDTKHYINSFL